MTDQPIDQSTNYEQVSLEVAADRLGISVNAVRQRLKRGTLMGQKAADGWLVDWQPTIDHAADRPTIDQPTTHLGRRPTRTDQTTTKVIGVLRDILDEERTALASERARVERLIEAAAVWQIRALQAEDRLKQLTSGPIETDDEVSGVDRADFARPEPAGDAVGDAERATEQHTEIDTVERDASPSAIIGDAKKPWWKFW